MTSETKASDIKDRDKEIWILEDDKEYLKALSLEIEKEFEVTPKTQSYIEPLYKDLVKRQQYPDVFIIDLLNRPTALRGRSNRKVRLFRFLRAVLGPMYYYLVFRPGSKRLEQLLNNPAKLNELNITDVLCWPWGGLQLLAMLADKKFVPVNENTKRPKIIVNSIVNFAATEIWNLPQVEKTVYDKLIPRIDQLLAAKFLGKDHPPSEGTYAYITYILKGDCYTSTNKQGDKSPASKERIIGYSEAISTDVEQVLNTLKKI